MTASFHPALATAHDLGAFYTPHRTADHMASMLEITSDDRILEPAAGDGSLIAACLRQGAVAEQITAWEMNPREAQRLREKFPGITVDCRDSLLDTDIENECQFTKIIANPPYLNKQSSYIKTHREKLRARFAKSVGASETYVMFLRLACDLLTRDGQLVFLVSDTLRTLATHRKIREHILAERNLHTVMRLPDRLFPDASVDTVVVKVQASPQQNTTVRVLPYAKSEDDYQRGAWRSISQQQLATIPASPFLVELPSTLGRLFVDLPRLSDVARSHVGMHTTMNAEVLAAVEGSDLADRYRRRRDVPGQYPVISRQDAASDRWMPYLKEGGEKDFWAPQVEYVDWSRHHEYKIPAGELFGLPGGLAVSGISRRLSARRLPVSAYWDTNKVFGVVPNVPTWRDPLIGLLCSDVYTYLAKRMLNDSSSLQLSNLMSLPVPQLTDHDRFALGQITGWCVIATKNRDTETLDQLRRQLNETVADLLRVSESDRDVVREFLRSRNLPSWL